MPKKQLDLEGDFTYEGAELDLFSGATNWKQYWSSIIKPFIGDSVLEVGAGIGANTKLFAACKFEKWIAIEPDCTLVNRVNKDCQHSKYPANFEIYAIKIEDVPSDCKFDTILYVDVLEHIQDDKKELEYAAKRLKSGGKIIILSPANDYLYTSFDRAIGHYRRYNKRTLLSIKPEGMKVDSIFYIDSIGMLASLGNKLLLKSERPTTSQIQFWDKCLVPMSRRIDKLILNRIGKSIIGIFQIDHKTEQ